MIELLYVAIGIVILWLSAEFLIRTAQDIAHHLGISETFIGLTILSIGTSLPEIGAHIAASTKILQGTDLSGIAVGTNVGSNIFQITVILGIVALFMKVKASKKFLDNDYLVMLGSIGLLFVFCLDGKLSRFEGAFLIIAYLIYLYRLGEVENFVGKIGHNPDKKVAIIKSLLLPLWILGLWISSNLVVNNAHTLSINLGVSDTLIGVLITGLGTALPELASAIIALKNKSSSMSIGVLVGSNITNPLFGIGIGAVISKYTIGSSLIRYDIPMWFFFSIIALLFFWRRGKIQKKEAVILISCYIVFAFLRLRYFS